MDNLYKITISGGRVAELFHAASAPAEAVAVSDADGEMLRRAPRFADYTVSNDGVIDHDPLPDPVAEREAAKAARAATVERIRVTTTAGHEFDGDETSQNRMARAILGLSAAAPGTTINWTLADNSVIQADVAELTEALMLAGASQAALWVLP